MTTKEQLEKVITDVGFTLSSLQILETSLTDASLIMDDKITLIENTLLEIDAAAQVKLDELAQEQVMASFLSELKVVFDTYNAILEVGSDESGYGESYGTGGSVGIKLTATLDNVLATKEINKAVIVGDDLI